MVSVLVSTLGISGTGSARVTRASETVTSGGRGCLVSIYLNGRPFGGRSGPGAMCSNRCVEMLHSNMV